MEFLRLVELRCATCACAACAAAAACCCATWDREAEEEERERLEEKMEGRAELAAACCTRGTGSSRPLPALLLALKRRPTAA